MGPSGVGESNSGQSQPAVGVMEPPVNPVTTTQINPNSAPNPLSGLENAINAAKKALGQTESPAPQAMATEPIAESVVPQSPTEQFQSTFGDAVPQASQTPSETVPSASVEPTQAPVAEFSSIPIEVAPPPAGPAPQVPEAQPPAEVKLPPKVQEFLDSVLAAAEKYKAPEENKARSS